MLRTQVYLTKPERDDLLHLSEQTGKTQSELIREAVDLLILTYHQKKQDMKTILKAAKGLWAKRNDLPDFAKLRAEFNARESSED